MADRPDKKSDYVKKDTMLIVAIVAFAIGFFGGVVLTVYKTRTGESVRSPASAPAPQQAQPVQDNRTEMAAKIFELERKTAQSPDDVGAWVQLGNLYFDTDNYTKAITAYEKSLELDPKNANVWTDLGVMYRRNGQPEEAVKTFDRAIQADPRHETSRFNKGVVLMHDLKDIEGAIKAWEGLLALNPLAVSSSGQPIDQLVQQLKQRQ